MAVATQLDFVVKFQLGFVYEYNPHSNINVGSRHSDVGMMTIIWTTEECVSIAGKDRNVYIL
jgi:hypothetical protein